MHRSRDTSQDLSLALSLRIRERVRQRLGMRVRNLTVQVEAGSVRLGGECATYYTKQLAQQAILGVLEDEVVVNEIVVTLPQPVRDLR